MRVVRRIVIGFLLLVGILVVVLGFAGVLTVRRSFPPASGEVQMSGLDAPVDIYFDRFGIPHIYARTEYDLFFAQGWVHARDRFWQMDFWRNAGAGRLAEMFGESQLDTDRFLRTLGWERVARQELASLDPESRAVLQAYADGINAYLADHQGSALSLEYAVLGLLTPDYRPDPWELVDTLVFAKLQAWNLSGNMDTEIERAVLLRTLSPEQVDALYPAYPERHPVIVRHPHLTGVLPEAERTWALGADLAPALASVRQGMARLSALVGERTDGLGSNSWAVSGELTDTGLPLLANDPHLAAQMPSIWYEIGLHCRPKGPDCSYDVTGFSFASGPGVVIGHNDRIAWGLTNLGPDVMDLYIEKINPENPNQYEYNGEWVDMELATEIIQVGGGDPVEQTVRITRHGPIISETYGPLEAFDQNAGVPTPESYAIALRWTALDPGLTIRAVLGFDRASNWEEFRAAARDFAVPSQNLLYADIDGNIGYQSPGSIPIRNPDHSGLYPVPGWTDEYEWQGFINFEDLPFSFNPPEGYLVTANNAVVGSEYPFRLAEIWHYGYRAERIVQMIENAPGPIDQAYMQRMQSDNMDLNAQQLLPVLFAVPLEDEELIEIRSRLNNWNYQTDRNSGPAAIFEVFWKHLLAAAFRDDFPEDYWPGGGSRWFEVVRLLLDDPESIWWDDQTTPEVEDRDQIFARAFAEATMELKGRLGGDPDRWRWGDLHTLTLENQTLGQSGIAPLEALFNRGPYPTAGGTSIVNATGWSARAGDYTVQSLPSMRMVVDLSDLSRSVAIHTTGQSGHAFHPHYVDMAELWENFEYHPMLWDRPSVEAAAEGAIRLVP